VVIYLILIPWALYKNVRFFRNIFSTILYAIPFLGHALRKLSVARFSSTMAMGINAGLEIRKAISYSAQTMTNPFLERRARKAIDYINNGNSIAQSLSMTGVFPTLICHMYETGEQSGTLFEMMQKVASLTQDQAENALKTISQIVPRAIYLIFVGYIAFKIIGFWQMIYSNLFNTFDI
jgi:type IV pilus assembly protein PilC